MPFAGAVLAVASGTPSSSEVPVFAEDFVEVDAAGADDVEPAADFVSWRTRRSADRSGSESLAAHLQDGRVLQVAHAALEAETPLRERSSSDL
jgi:hypothetical protein